MAETILFGFWKIGDWNLFVIWCLGFGASHHGHAQCPMPFALCLIFVTASEDGGPFRSHRGRPLSVPLMKSDEPE